MNLFITWHLRHLHSPYQKTLPLIKLKQLSKKYVCVQLIDTISPTKSLEYRPETISITMSIYTCKVSTSQLHIKVEPNQVPKSRLQFNFLGSLIIKGLIKRSQKLGLDGPMLMFVGVPTGLKMWRQRSWNQD